MANLTFERLKESHVKAIHAIEAISQPSPWSERAFLNELTNPHSLFLVVMLGKDVIGYGGVWNLIDEAHVTTMMIAPEQRGNKYGKNLICELLIQSIEAGMTCATLEVRASNEVAIKLYEGIGFGRVALRKRYDPDNQEDAVVMWLYDLENWEPSV